MNLVFSNPYSRKDLSVLLDENIEGTQEGIFYCKRDNNGATLLFVTLNKEGRKEHLQFNDYFEDDLFHWDSQPKQSIGVPTIKAITEGKSPTFLFARVDAKQKPNEFLHLLWFTDLLGLRLFNSKTCTLNLSIGRI